MSNNKQILRYCPNFYKIINFNTLVEDELTNKIIKIYQEYIFKINIYNEEEVNEVMELDEAIGHYINDYLFRKQLKKEIVELKVKNDCRDILRYFIQAIIRIFNTYQEGTTRIIYISRWI